MGSSLLTHILESYQSPHPADWVGAYRYIPTWIGIVLVAIGVLLLLFGGGRAFRFVAGPMAALAGFLWIPLVAERFDAPLDPRNVGIGAAAVLAAIGFALPAGGVFFAFGLLAGLLGGQLAGADDWALGFFPAFLFVGAIAGVLHRFIGAVASALLGAWLLCLGLLAALHMATVIQAVASQAWAVLIAAVMFGVAGSIYQLAVRPSQADREKLKQEKAKAKAKLAEKKALEERWANYSARREE